MLFANAMPRASAIVFACALLVAALRVPLPAATDVDALAARAGMCDAFSDLAFTFCVALCEARACDQIDPGDERCAILQRGFARVTGGVTPPCANGPAPSAEAL